MLWPLTDPRCAIGSAELGRRSVVVEREHSKTTALLQGRPAPRLVADAQLATLRPGSVVVDLPVESGGNVEGRRPGEVVKRHGVRIVGAADGASRLAADASNLFARNIAAFVEAYLDKGAQRLELSDDGDPLVDAVRLTRGGRVVHPRFVTSLAA